MNSLRLEGCETGACELYTSQLRVLCDVSLLLKNYVIYGSFWAILREIVDGFAL